MAAKRSNSVERSFIVEIPDSYLDVWGTPRRIDRHTRAVLRRALGAATAAPKKLFVKSGRCYQPEVLDGGGRVWGFTVQLYGLRSGRNWGIGDFGDLGTLIELAARLGAAMVGVNPLHATNGVSPYSPSSRLALNVLYLNIEEIPEYPRCPAARRHVESAAFQRQLDELRKSELVDYERIRTLKFEVLELLFRQFQEKEN